MPWQVGDPAPLFSDPDILTGDTFKLADHTGKCVLVAFHGITWCPPCAFAAPILQELWNEEYHNNPKVQFVIISVNERPSAATLQNMGFTIPWLLDPAVPVAYQIGNSVPHYFFLDDTLTIYKIQPGLFCNNHDAQKQAVRESIEECLQHQPPEIDVGHWAAVATILVGVAEGGGGYILSGGKIIKIPPGDPPFRHLSAAKKDLLVALSVGELSALIRDPEAQRKIEASALDAAESALRRLKDAARAQDRG
jgi:peroxiredoxin